MDSIKYEKPAMRFVSLRNEQKVANTCWGHHSSDKKLYADLEGPGFAEFQIAQGSCELNLINVQYYNSDTDGDGKIGVNDTPTPLKMSDSKYLELQAKLKAAGGSQGNPFKGEGSIVTENSPNPQWS